MTTLPTRSRRLTILVVDDHEELLAAMADFLEDAGHTVRLAPSGKLAVYRLLVEEGKGVDVVITDLRMPGIDGLDLYRIATIQRPALARRFIFVTGSALEAFEADELRSAQVPIIDKPFLFSTLDMAIDEVASRDV